MGEESSTRSGWKTTGGVAAAFTLALAGLLHRRLPDLPAARPLSYLALLRSTGALLREEPVLRLRAAFGFLGFSAFTILWTSVAFLLASPPYSFSEAVIGLFGLAGAAGAAAAQVTGRLADRGRDRLATGTALAAVLAGWALMSVNGGHQLVTFIAGILILDLGVQGAHVTNLAVIYRRRPEARSRLTTAYMVSVFLGGAAGSAASGAAYAAGGWIAVAVTGAAVTGAALILWAVSARVHSSARKGT